jgi:hypothetical protein
MLPLATLLRNMRVSASADRRSGGLRGLRPCQKNENLKGVTTL